jgi:hypothetical protein
MSEEANTTAAPLPEVAAPEPAPARPEEPEAKDKDNADAIGGDAVASAPEPVKEVATEVSAPVEGMFALRFSRLLLHISFNLLIESILI